jgi:hypothetical protein
MASDTISTVARALTVVMNPRRSIISYPLIKSIVLQPPVVSVELLRVKALWAADFHRPTGFVRARLTDYARTGRPVPGPV